VRGAPASCALALLATLAACGGGGGGGGPKTSLGYPSNPAIHRVGEPALPNVPTVAVGSNPSFVVLPALPSGLLLDPLTGTVSGVPDLAAPTATYLVTATGSAGSATADLVLQVAPALPAEVVSLAPGYEIAQVAQDLAFPSKLAFAPDGRLFFTELHTGNVRVLSGGSLLPTPFATVPVLTGPEQGLLGIAIAADFASSGHVFLVASTPAEAGPSGKPERHRVLRLTATGDVGGDLTVIVDDLPIALLHNGGDVEVGPDGHLYVTVGDTAVDTLAQTDGALAGRVLRYTTTGAIPADNPIPGSPEWCRGLRNTFDLTFHPVTGGLFGSENGPTAQDEVNFLQPGKDYGWPNPSMGPTTGFRVAEWTPVIAPTGLVFGRGGAMGPGLEDDLFLAGYVDEDVRRLALSGPARTDLDAEYPFLQFAATGGANKPLDLALGLDGALWISTFDALYRVTRYP
jgi:glucose/arabinose dehydrogenase